MRNQTSTTPSKRPRLSVDVANRLRKLIDDRTWIAGQQLPTELKMIEMFGVSRTVIREAISALGAEGLVVPQHGRGVFVAEHLPARPFRLGDSNIDETDHIRQSMELRLGIETEAAALAATRRTDAELAAMKQALDIINQLNSECVGGAAEDFDFHVKIAQAAHNSVRRQGFRDQWLPKLRESLAHLVCLIMRLAGGDASVALRVFSF